MKVIEKLVDKILEKKAKEIIAYAKGYIIEHKDEIIDKLKAEAENYISEHKEEIIKLVKDEVTELVVKAIRE